MALDYLKIQGDVLVSHGPDAAVLLALISFRSHQDEGWVATYSDIEFDVGMSPRRIRAAAETLRQEGLLETTAAGLGRTLRWWPKRQNGRTQTSKRHLDTVYRETNITNTADAGSEAVMSDADVTPIDGGLFPPQEVERREPSAAEWAQECRKVWLDRFRDAVGQDPHPDTSSKAFGHIKRACSRSVTQDHFRDVWRAARDAGSQGRWQVQVDAPLPQAHTRGGMGTNIYASMLANGYGQDNAPALTSDPPLRGIES